MYIGCCFAFWVGRFSLFLVSMVGCCVTVVRCYYWWFTFGFVVGWLGIELGLW